MSPSGSLASSSTEPVSRLRTSILRNVSHGANDIYWFVLPPVLPLILVEFGLRYAAAGGIVSAFLCVTAVGSMVMGRLSDKVSRIRLITAGFLLASAALWAAALMPTLPLIIAFIVLGGIGVSTYHPTAYASISDSGLSRGRTYGQFEASGGIAITAMLGLQGLLVASIGWRGALAVGAVPGAFMGVLFLFLPNASIGEKPKPRTDSSPARTRGASASLALPVLFVIAIMLRVLGVNAVQNFAPTYLVHAADMAPGMASFAVGLIFFGGVAGALLFGRITERRGTFPMFALATGLLVPVIPLVGLRLPPVIYLVLLAVMGFCSSACLPAQNMILSGLTAGRARGQVFGTLMGMTTFMASASPLVFGLIADASSLQTAILASTVPVAFGWTVTFIVWRLHARSAAAEPRP